MASGGNSSCYIESLLTRRRRQIENICSQENTISLLDVALSLVLYDFAEPRVALSPRRVALDPSTMSDTPPS